MKVVTTLLKLVFAAAVLCIGWMALKPLATTGWPLDWAIQPWIERAAASGPIDRIGLGVVTLLFGAACLLAAVPKSVKDRSPRKKAAPLVMEPVALAVSDEATPHGTASHDPFPSSPVRPVPDFSKAEPEAQPILDVAPVPVSIAPAPLVEEVETAPSDFIDELAHARKALVSDPSPSSRSHLADLLKKDGDIAEGEGRLDHAITAYEESVELRRAVLAAGDQNAREQRWLWTTLESLAECREDRGHRTRAAALYREGLEAGERATALAPEEAAYPAELETTRARLSALEAQLVV